MICSLMFVLRRLGGARVLTRDPCEVHRLCEQEGFKLVDWYEVGA